MDELFPSHYQNWFLSKKGYEAISTSIFQSLKQKQINNIPLLGYENVDRLCHLAILLWVYNLRKKPIKKQNKNKQYEHSTIIMVCFLLYWYHRINTRSIYLSHTHTTTDRLQVYVYGTRWDSIGCWSSHSRGHWVSAELLFLKWYPTI